jgi:hypothetical protein
MSLGVVLLDCVAVLFLIFIVSFKSIAKSLLWCLRKMNGQNLEGVKFHTWKYHKKTLCVAAFITNKQKYYVFIFIFSLLSSAKSENRRAKQVL